MRFNLLRENISYNEFLAVREEYLNLLNMNKFPIFDCTDTIEILKFLKREKKNICCYESITPFEAANRIGSDLVLLNGIQQIISSNQSLIDCKISISLGNENTQMGDFKIGESHGEVFNVAQSFFKSKLRNTLIKWSRLTPTLKYILYNSELEKEMIKHLERKKTKDNSIIYFPVVWD